MRYIVSILVACFATIQTLSAACGLYPQSLKCEYLTNPEAVDSPTPRLSWINRLGEGSIGECQTAWQIEVASTKEKLEAGNADVWNSGKIDGASAPFFRYGGKQLEPATKYWWHVRVWDKSGAVSIWSEPACWGTGIMGQWKAQWIGAPWDKEGPRDIIEGKTLSELYPNIGDLDGLQKVAPSTPAPIFRKTFRIEKPVASARLYTTGLGYFEASLNGDRIGNEVLVPNQTDYSDRILMDKRRLPLLLKNKGMSVMYLGYDLTSRVAIGENSLEYVLGNGFFNSVQVWTAGYGSPRMIAQLEIIYCDGSRETVISDSSWKVRESAIRTNDVFAGETYDARIKETPWQDVVIRNAPLGKLVSQTGPSDRVTGELQPVAIEKCGECAYRVKFCEEIAGRVVMKNIPGREGDTIRVRFLNGSVADYDYNGKIEYISDGNAGSYATRFSWFVFDGCIVENWDGPLTAENIKAEIIHSDVDLCASFHCSDPMIDSLVRIWQRTELNNMHGSVPTDCPHRERGPYTGDGQLTAAMVMHNFDARAFYLKWIEDIRNSQDSVTGYVPNSAPWEPGCGGGVAWGAAMTILPWEYYEAYGNLEVLREYYPAMKAQTDYMESWMTKDGTMLSDIDHVYYMNLGEHVPPFTSPTQEMVHTYVWWQCCDIIYKAAEALGLQWDADRYYDKCGDILGQFIAKFYNWRNGSYGKDECDIFALKMGVLDSDKVIEDLKRNLKERDGHILSGYVGTRIFFETLSEYGLDEEAFKALTAKGYPGYMEMIDKGSTTMWEQWDGKHSHDHPGLGSGLIWLYRTLAGVKIDRALPAYRHFEISPFIPQDLDHVTYFLKTIYGPLKSSWQKTPSGLEMDITVPEGCTCTLRWPVDKKPEESEGITRNFNGTYTLTSGSFHIR